MDITTLNLLSAKEAAQLLEVNSSRFHRIVIDYNIPHQRLSCGMVFLKEDIEAFQESRKPKLKYRRNKS